MAIRYDAATRKWVVNNEKINYQTNFKIDNDTSRSTNNPTSLKTDYPIPSLLPTNLPFDYPVNARTDFPVNAPTTQTLYVDTQLRQTSKAQFREVIVDVRTTPKKWYDPVTVDKNSTPQSILKQTNGQIWGFGAWDKITPVQSTLSSNEATNKTNTATNAANAKKNQDNTILNNQNYQTNVNNANANIEIQQTQQKNQALNSQNATTNSSNVQLNQTNNTLNNQALALNQKNTQLNADNLTLNTQNTAINNEYSKTVSLASTTQGGDYVKQRDQITVADLTAAGMPLTEAKEIVDSIQAQYKLFYQTEKLVPWDAKLGVQPPYGTFDPNYYKTQNTTVNEAWKNAVAADDIDITERYGENNFYLQHYGSTGKAQGLRGNKEEDTARANQYIEQEVTDAELQQIRDLQLGIDQDTITQRLLNITEVSNEWTKARNGDPYWSALAKEKYLDPSKPEEFAVLFRLSERPEDKQIALNYNVNAGSGITEMEQALNDAIGAKAEIDVKKFAGLNQAILKDTIAQMKKVKGEQEAMAFYRGFSGFAEVMDLNKELSNSILGDSGVGGILSITSAGKAEESLMGALQNVTGMRNNVIYNWQQWFDKSIKEKYGIDYAEFEPLEEKKDIIKAFTSSELTQKPFNAETNQFDNDFLKSAGFASSTDLIAFLEKQGEEGLKILDIIKGDPGETSNSVLIPVLSRIEADIKTIDQTKDRGVALSYSTADKTEIMNIEAQFARDYIDEYLMPRFNTARSMDEFVEYLDIRQEEQNPFQTQDSYDALKSLSTLYSKKYLDDIQQQDARSFDPNFYFAPTGDVSRINEYQEQKETVEKDWEAAKNGDSYWNSQAYRFGIDINNKAAFARMHFEVKGQGKGYDAADDIVNAGKVKDYIFSTVLPVLEKETKKLDAVFGTFIKPEEFADEMLRGLDPAKTPEAWKEVLQRYGLTEFEGTIDDLKEYIIEALRGGSAQEIREQIKYLNEKRQKPTQEILGVTYIDRPEDYKDEMAKPTTQLYSIFQKSGYQGTEDEFYENMFPDLDRSEQTLLTKAGQDTALKSYGLDLSDPFASLGTIESFFPENKQDQDKETAKESAKDFYTSYFKIGEDDDEDQPEKSDAAKSFLGEFTSLFKGI